MNDKPIIRFKYVWENISDPAVYDTITGYFYFINDEDDIERIVGLLNNLHQKNQQLKHYNLYEDNKRLQTIIADLKDENERLRLELETHKHPLWSTREAERKLSEVTNNLVNEIKQNGLLNEEINQLRIENMRLKKKCGDSI